MIIETLTQRRNEIASQIKELNQNLVHIDATIKLFRPEYRVSKVRVVRGGIAREMLNIMRNANAPMTSYQIAEKMVGVGSPELRITAKRVGATLYNYHKKGMIKSTQGEGNAKLWELRDNSHLSSLK